MPIVKDKGLMLSWTSSHSNAVHLSWPVAYIKRLHSRVSTVDSFVQAKMQFLSNLRRNYVPEFLLQHFHNCTQYYLPYDQICRTIRYKKQDVMYLVPPFHRLWHASSLTGAIREFGDSSATLLHESFSKVTPFGLKISWKLPELPFGSTLIKW